VSHEKRSPTLPFIVLVVAFLIEKTGPEFLDQHRISVCCEITFPEFLELAISFVFYQNTFSRISGARTFFRHDPKHTFFNKKILKRTQHFGRIEKNGPKLLDRHRISV
jgi:hypothetical protein